MTSQCDLLTVVVQFRMRGGVVRTIRKKDELGTEFFFCMGVQSVGELQYEMKKVCPSLQAVTVNKDS